MGETNEQNSQANGEIDVTYTSKSLTGSSDQVAIKTEDLVVKATLKKGDISVSYSNQAVGR